MKENMTTNKFPVEPPKANKKPRRLVKLLVITIVGTIILVGGGVFLSRMVNGTYTGKAEIIRMEVKTGSCVLTTAARDGIQRSNSFGGPEVCSFLEVGDKVNFKDSHPIPPNPEDHE